MEREMERKRAPDSCRRPATAITGVARSGRNAVRRAVHTGVAASARVEDIEFAIALSKFGVSDREEGWGRPKVADRGLFSFAETIGDVRRHR